jgi:NADPH:quinone reductase-like Zn-dependent oxidoreductase
MKAVVQVGYGSADVLESKEIDRPVAADDDVLVRVHAASLAAGDYFAMRGAPFPIRMYVGFPRPKKNYVVGVDLAGRVEAVGKNVTRFKPGDEVFGGCSRACAEYTCAKEDQLVPKPNNLTFEQAAAVPTSALAALQALRDHGKVQPGQKVLINGAGGGIGTFAVQIARSLGAHVTGVCSTTKVDLVSSLGADRVIDYTRDDFTLGDERYDLILDNVLNHPLSQLVRALTPGGMLIPNGGQFHKRWTASAGVILIQAPLLSLVVPQRIRHVTLTQKRDGLLALGELLGSGKVTPVIGRTFPLSHVPGALAYFGQGHARGKVVITV